MSQICVFPDVPFSAAQTPPAAPPLGLAPTTTKTSAVPTSWMTTTSPRKPGWVWVRLAAFNFYQVL